MRILQRFAAWPLVQWVYDRWVHVQWVYVQWVYFQWAYVRNGTDSSGPTKSMAMAVPNGTAADGTVLNGMATDGTVRNGIVADGTVPIGSAAVGTTGSASPGSVRTPTPIHVRLGAPLTDPSRWEMRLPRMSNSTLLELVAFAWQSSSGARELVAGCATVSVSELLTTPEVRLELRGQGGAGVGASLIITCSGVAVRSASHQNQRDEFNSITPSMRAHAITKTARNATWNPSSTTCAIL
jgi:hypothetical protein